MVEELSKQKKQVEQLENKLESVVKIVVEINIDIFKNALYNYDIDISNPIIYIANFPLL